MYTAWEGQVLLESSACPCRVGSLGGWPWTPCNRQSILSAVATNSCPSSSTACLACRRRMRLGCPLSLRHRSREDHHYHTAFCFACSHNQTIWTCLCSWFARSGWSSWSLIHWENGLSWRRGPCSSYWTDWTHRPANPLPCRKTV